MTEITGNEQATLVFKVTRQTPVLVPPAKPTPHEFKKLSHLDLHDLQYHQQTPTIMFYKNSCLAKGQTSCKAPYSPRLNNELTAGRDLHPAKVIKNAISKALVSYYPFAGRIRKRQGDDMVVECTGEGIIFIEADADVALLDFGEPIHPPFPCIDELLYDVPGSSSLIDTPLILIQVTRFRCGGFALAMRTSHIMADATGLNQFMTAVGELARGVNSPSVEPVWQRHLLRPREPPQVTCVHPEYDEIVNSNSTSYVVPLTDMVRKCFFFGPKEIAALSRFIPLHLAPYTTFEIITAYLWRCHTVALGLHPEEKVRLRFVVNTRSKINPPLPASYYGNVTASALAMSTAGKLSNNPIGYALELIKQAKAHITSEFMKSLLDLFSIKGKTMCNVARTYVVVSNINPAGFEGVDFGWGFPVYAGITREKTGPKPGGGCYYLECKDYKGESGIMVPLCLSRQTMEKFVEELNVFLSDVPKHTIVISRTLTRKSSL